jgi:hypothetical protein
MKINENQMECQFCNNIFGKHIIDLLEQGKK